MAVRTAYAPVAATVLTAANLAKLPGGWIGYAEVTASQGSITTTVDLTGLTLSVTVGTGRRLRITAQCQFSSTVGGDYASMAIMEGGTTINSAGAYPLPLVGTGSLATLSAVITPTSGAHTYKLQAARAAGTGTVSMSASAAGPAFILVEDIGATP